jgi:hypothetical protein
MKIENTTYANTRTEKTYLIEKGKFKLRIKSKNNPSITPTRNVPRNKTKNNVG